MELQDMGLEQRNAIVRLAAAVRRAARAANHRRALVLTGARHWCRATAAVIVKAAALDEVLWLSDEAPEGVPALQGASTHKVLGRELDGVVLDAYAGFDPDALGAVAGAIHGGGLLLLLVPPLAEWPHFDDPQNERVAVFPFRSGEIRGRYLKRLSRLIRGSGELSIIEQGSEPDELLWKEEPSPNTPVDVFHSELYRTLDQQQAVEAILHVVTGHRRRPVVLTSDRGRGKSAALGIAAARLIEGGLHNIIVTAPRLDAVEPLFEHAGRLLPDARIARGVVNTGNAAITFYPPDRLLAEEPNAELLLVDEAAAIPTPLLQGMLERYSRTVFATTVHGYEGTGRGFALRFCQILEQLTPEWKAVQLETPVRWAADDPVERFLFKALLLDAAPVEAPRVSALEPGECTIERIDREWLVENESTLHELFGLLVLAHYRTTPLDLRHLLDGPNLSIRVMRFNGHVVATALVAREGGIEPQLGHAIYLGKRRLHGHLIPQSLAVHAGFEEAPTLICDRVMRIAVHPAVQGRGVGSMLLKELVKQAEQEGIDYIGSSFGASEALLRFWCRGGFEPVRAGLTREAASGSHSVMLMKPISEAGQALFSRVRQRFLEHLPYLLSDPLRDLEPQLAGLLWHHEAACCDDLSAQDWRDLDSFAFGRRGYEVCMAPIIKLVSLALGEAARGVLSSQQESLLLLRVLQRRSWQEVVERINLNGKREAQELLRQAVAKLMRDYSTEKL